MRKLFLMCAALVAGGTFAPVWAGPAFAGEAIVVKITDLAFSPATIKAKAGDTVTWVNEDFVDHTATAKNDSFDLAIPAGQSARLDLTQAGEIAYFCRAHPNGTGTIEVH